MYEQFYDLQSKPFRLSPDARFFFASREHARALTRARYGLSRGEGFIVITGGPGTGKTTLAKTLLREVSLQGVMVAELSTTPGHNDILSMVMASLGQAHEGLNTIGLRKKLNAYLLDQSRKNSRIILMVDEAQNLSSTALEELLRLTNLRLEGDKALIQIFILGQDPFRHRLSRPELAQFRQRVIANYHLGELAENECQLYVESRLQQVGWKGDPRFTAEVYQAIHQYTQGIPRRISMICDRLLLVAAYEKRHEINTQFFRYVTNELKDGTTGLTGGITPASVNFGTIQDYRDSQASDTGFQTSKVDFFVQPGSQQQGRNTAPASNTSSSLTPMTRDEVSDLWKLLRLVLAYYRSPTSFPGLSDPKQPLVRGIRQLLAMAVADDQTLQSLGVLSDMGLTPGRFREAVRVFIRNVLFSKGSDDYRVLGLTADATEEQIQSHFRLLQQLIAQENRPDESGMIRVRDSYDRLSRDKGEEAGKTPVQKWMTNEEIEKLGLDLDFESLPGREPVEPRKFDPE